MTTGAKKVTWTSGKSQGFLGEPDCGDIEDEKAYAHLMRTLSVLLDQIVDVMFPCTRADTQLVQPTLRTMGRWTRHTRWTGRERRLAPVGAVWVPRVRNQSTPILVRAQARSGAQTNGKVHRKCLLYMLDERHDSALKFVQAQTGARKWKYIALDEHKAAITWKNKDTEKPHGRGRRRPSSSDDQGRVDSAV